MFMGYLYYLKAKGSKNKNTKHEEYRSKAFIGDRKN